MKKIRSFILVLAFTTSHAFSQKNSEVINTTSSDFDNFYWIDTLENGSIENYEHMYFYKDSRASRFTMIAETRDYFSRLYDHFKKHLDELGKIIDFGKGGYDGIRVISKTINGKKSCHCILLSLHNEYSSFDKSNNVLMVIRNEDYTLKVICPFPW